MKSNMGPNRFPQKYVPPRLTVLPSAAAYCRWKSFPLQLALCSNLGIDNIDVQWSGVFCLSLPMTGWLRNQHGKHQWHWQCAPWFRSFSSVQCTGHRHCLSLAMSMSMPSMSLTMSLTLTMSMSVLVPCLAPEAIVEQGNPVMHIVNVMQQVSRWHCQQGCMPIAFPTTSHTQHQTCRAEKPTRH